MASLILPNQVPLHLNVIGTRKGAWLVRVDSMFAASDCEEVALQLVLERTGDEQSAKARRLYMVCSERDLHVPQRRVLIADQIRHWLETKEGNGVRNLDQENMYAA